MPFSAEERKTLGIRRPWTRKNPDKRMIALDARVIGRRHGALIGVRRDGKLWGRAAFIFRCALCKREVRLASQAVLHPRRPRVGCRWDCPAAVQARIDGIRKAVKTRAMAAAQGAAVHGGGTVMRGKDQK